MTDVFGIPVHPAAELLPMLPDDELRRLAEDIRANGLHEQPWVWNDPGRGPVLLDGRNRLAACKLAGVRPTTRTYVGDDPVSFVISGNVLRRHLTAMQRAGLAARSLPLYEAQTKAAEADRQRKAIESQRSKPGAALHQVNTDERESRRAPQSRDKAAEERRKSTSLNVTELDEETQVAGAALHQPHSGESQGTTKRKPRSTDKAAQAAGVSGRSVAQYKRIAEHAPDLLTRVDAGDLSGDRAEQLLKDRLRKRGQKVPTPIGKRRPLTATAKESALRLRKEIERLEQTYEDDRFAQNIEQVATLTRSHLTYTAEAARRLLDILDKETTSD